MISTLLPATLGAIVQWIPFKWHERRKVVRKSDQHNIYEREVKYKKKQQHDVR